MSPVRKNSGGLTREIYRTHSSIDALVGNYATTKTVRAKLRKISFDLIDLEENIRSASEKSIAFEVNRFNNSLFDSQFSIKMHEKTIKLTKKEIEVVRLLSSGPSIKALAKEMYLTEATIKSHLTSIYRKLGVSNRVQAIAVARENNLLTF